MVDVVSIATQWFLLLAFTLELIIKIVLNPGQVTRTVEEHEAYDKISQNQRSTALSTAGLVIAGLALLLTNTPTQYTVQIELFVVSFGFLLTAAFTHELTLTKEVILTVQELSLEYGLLVLAYAFVRLVAAVVPDASTTAYVVFALVFIIRFLSVPGELRAHNNH